MLNKLLSSKLLGKWLKNTQNTCAICGGKIIGKGFCSFCEFETKNGGKLIKIFQFQKGFSEKSIFIKSRQTVEIKVSEPNGHVVSEFILK